MSNKIKFVGSIAMVNEDVDMDVELVRDMLKSDKGRLEVYDTAATTPGEIYIVDADLGLAEGIATMLNEAYAEFLDAESAAAHAAASSAREAVNTAFEGDSRVPVSGSAEDAALANLDKPVKKETTKNQTKNEKVETEMTNSNNQQTQEQINAQSAAAKAFLAAQGSKIQQAKKGEIKKEETTTTEGETTVKKEETKKPTVGNKGNRGVGKPNVELTTKKPSVKVNTESTKNEKDVVNVNNKNEGRQSAGNTAGRNNAGTTVKVNVEKVVTNNRIEFEESNNTFNKFNGPWYLNAGLHPEVEMLEELIAMRKVEAFGIKDIRPVNPDTVLKYDNHGVLAIVEVTTEGKKGDNVWSIRIQKETREGKTADLNSSNIGWETVDGELRPVYQYYKKNEENMVSFSTKNGRKVAELKGMVADEEEGVVYYSKVDKEGTVHGFKFDAAKEEITALTDKQYAIPNYVPVVKKEVNKEVLVLAIAFAQYALGYNMHGVVAE
jgi:hypothetical protein